MQLGAFSVSLAVKDIEASKLFYEKLGFTVFAGDQSQNWLAAPRRPRAARAGVEFIDGYA
jgi:catechol 2,3-dioxygenase-like lactoylglutathione lyase family enzyme